MEALLQCMVWLVQHHSAAVIAMERKERWIDTLAKLTQQLAACSPSAVA